MKRIFSALSAVLILLSLAACKTTTPLRLPVIQEYIKNTKAVHENVKYVYVGYYGGGLAMEIGMKVLEDAEVEAILGDFKVVAADKTFQEDFFEIYGSWTQRSGDLVWGVGWRPHITVFFNDAGGHTLYDYTAYYYAGGYNPNIDTVDEEKLSKIDGYTTWYGGKRDY